ncbi:MAG TPA: amidohydrolase family protein [Candidatus Acidoferrales bacterium]|nr:amidohydrolase family protein [Candidatus Acidoferrales bacterium]
MEKIPIIDADGHVTESNESLKKHLKKEYRNRPLMHSESWDRTFGGTLGKRNEDPKVQLADMDIDGIDIQVIFPSHLSLCAERETDLATDIARAYNDWLAEFCAADPRRLKGVAMVALQDVDAALKEVRRAVEQLGFVGVMMPTNVRDQDVGKREFWPFYEEVQRLNIGLALHGGIRAAERMHGRFDTFISVHSVSFPFECMAALTGLIFAGVLEKFPKLRIAALESCCGWVPFLMDRLDEEYEKRSREAPLLKQKPSEYMTSDQFFYAFELEESTVPYVIDRIGADKLLYSSDYPHWDTSWPYTVKMFTGRQDISDADKRQIAWNNPQNFYGFRVPA